MSAQLAPETIQLVKATVPALRQHGLAITQKMYEHLFKNEEIRDLFNQSHQGANGSQPKALAQAILAYAENIENLGALAPAVERIAQKHAGLNILPEHYPFVANALLQAISDILGDAASDDILKAWGEAYWFLANILIGREAEIYRETATVPGGWAGWRPFVIEKVEPESSVICSFYLRPQDGGAVISHKPGQYLTVLLQGDGLPPLKRNYTISCAPNGSYYRITVKREGRASTWLHEHAAAGTVLEVSPPAGDFHLDVGQSEPIVLVSGGVGLTPMVSMLETVAEKRPDLPTWYVHGALNGAVHAMGSHVRGLAQRSPNIDVKVFYADATSAVGEAGGCDEEGLISADWLHRNTPSDRATYFLCGPKPFLRDIAVGLRDAGVSPDRIRYEFFGPADDLLAA
ncbi:Flavohemoprotein [Candidatus Filomicrobium marinum]|uniref:nitric oxide dioxygenase n=1 Tax=Candidatus Filomicrobium marinum TaxID=1608628 RepID=A0A0D6JBJ7_9HYPH|nr:NO-inducible flavohemoprotein [Candidatus Filomicrobium marinum]CFX06616.1 Flavohemoprotein [Candidatus Filomicrobium marinum]CPR16461.1 Flavohemoprotein [Candidatus Filomicrobium marinum]